MPAPHSVDVERPRTPLLMWSLDGAEVARPRRVVPEHSSVACACLEKVWAILCRVEPRLPPNVTLIPLSAGEPRRVRGHFARSRWRYLEDEQCHEIAVSGALYDQPEHLLSTLVHEGAHAILENRHGGCGPSGRYHRKEFCVTARSLGLECLFVNNAAGWSATQWPEGGVPPRYAEVLELLCSEMPPGVDDPRMKIQRIAPRKLPKKGLLRMSCACSRSIQVTPAVARGAGIRCESCHALFVLTARSESDVRSRGIEV